MARIVPPYLVVFTRVFHELTANSLLCSEDEFENICLGIISGSVGYAMLKMLPEQRKHLMKIIKKDFSLIKDVVFEDAQDFQTFIYENSFYI